jgi:hypothetical protein
MAINYLAKGSVDEALVETRRTQLLFDEWDRQDTKDIKYTSDGMFHFLSSMLYDAAGASSDALISLYKSVQAYQAGPVPLPKFIKNYAYYRLLDGDRESDVKQLGLNPDVKEKQIPLLAGRSGSEIVVVGYSGKGPSLQENAWWGTYVKGGLVVLHYDAPGGIEQTFTMSAPPLPEKEYRNAAKGEKTNLGTTFHIKFAMPSVKTSMSQIDHFEVNGATAGKVESFPVNDCDVLAEKYLEDTRGSRLMRTIIRVTLRTIAAEKAKEKMSGDKIVANMLLSLGTDILADQLERADTRTCFLIPKKIHMARIPVAPGTHSVEITARDKSGNAIGTCRFEGVEVKSGEKKVIICPSFH